MLVSNLVYSIVVFWPICRSLHDVGGRLSFSFNPSTRSLGSVAERRVKVINMLLQFSDIKLKRTSVKTIKQLSCINSPDGCLINKCVNIHDDDQPYSFIEDLLGTCCLDFSSKPIHLAPLCNLIPDDSQW